MSIEIDINVTECDSDVTITEVETFTRVTDLDRFYVDVYLEDNEGHTINLEMASGAAYELWQALGNSELVKEYINEAEEAIPENVPSRADQG